MTFLGSITGRTYRLNNAISRDRKMWLCGVNVVLAQYLLN